jgi:hypothetical protein
MRAAHYLLGSVLILGGCVSSQLSSNTIDISATIAPIYIAQVLGNFSSFIDNPDTLPSQATLQAGIIQVTNTLTPSITFPVANMVATALGSTATTTTTRAGTGFTIGGSVSWQQNFTVQPITDPFSLRDLGVLYRAIVTGEGIEDYKPPRVYDRQDHLVPDPYYLQRPQCILCLKNANDPPLTDARSDLLNKTEPNKVFIGRWLHWTKSPPSPIDCPTAAPTGMVCIGSSRGYTFFVTSDRLSDFTKFVLLTLPLSPAPTRFSSVSAPPISPTVVPLPRKKGERVPAQPREILPQQLAPGPAEGTQRPNLLIVPQILQIPQ